jgi:hypothetical protein
MQELEDIDLHLAMAHVATVEVLKNVFCARRIHNLIT